MICCFPLLQCSHYWCRALPPLKLSSCICSVLVREICSSFGTPSASHSSRGFPAEPSSSALALFYKNSCQGWDVFLSVLILKVCCEEMTQIEQWCRCTIFNLDSQIWISIKYSHSLHIYPVNIFTFSRISLKMSLWCSVQYVIIIPPSKHEDKHKVDKCF